MSTSTHTEPAGTADRPDEGREEDLASARRRRRLLAIASMVPIAAIAALLIWGTVRSGGQPGGLLVNSDSGEVGVDAKLAPDFTITTFDGESATLSGLRGKVVMVDFWASWCPPCRRESPTLTYVYESFKGRGVEFIGVDVWDQEKAGREFVISNGLTYPNGIDVDGRITIDYGVTGIPEKFFIDREGRIVRKYVGPTEVEELTRILNEMLAES